MTPQTLSDVSLPDLLFCESILSNGLKPWVDRADPKIEKIAAAIREEIWRRRLAFDRAINNAAALEAHTRKTMGWDYLDGRRNALAEHVNRLAPNLLKSYIIDNLIMEAPEAEVEKLIIAFKAQSAVGPRRQ